MPNRPVSSPPLGIVPVGRVIVVSDLILVHAVEHGRHQQRQDPWSWATLNHISSESPTNPATRNAQNPKPLRMENSPGRQGRKDTSDGQTCKAVQTMASRRHRWTQDGAGDDRAVIPRKNARLSKATGRRSHVHPSCSTK